MGNILNPSAVESVKINNNKLYNDLDTTKCIQNEISLPSLNKVK